MNFTPYIPMDACAGNVTDVYKIGQELLMSVRNFIAAWRYVNSMRIPDMESACTVAI